MHPSEVQRQLADHLDTLHGHGVRSLRRFGSTARGRGEADASSDEVPELLKQVEAIRRIEPNDLDG